MIVDQMVGKEEMSGKHEIMQPPPGLFLLHFSVKLKTKKVKVKVDQMRGIGCQQGGEWKV